MKLRILNDYIRLRLSQSEVDEFEQTGKVQSELRITGNKLIYEIVKSDNTEVIATFEDNTISVKVPHQIANHWLKPEEVGFENTDQTDLRILIEKDFQCLHKRSGEDEKDSFPNPLAEKH